MSASTEQFAIIGISIGNTVPIPVFQECASIKPTSDSTNTPINASFLIFLNLSSNSIVIESALIIDCLKIQSRLLIVPPEPPAPPEPPKPPFFFPKDNVGSNLRPSFPESLLAFPSDSADDFAL